MIATTNSITPPHSPTPPPTPYDVLFRVPQQDLPEPLPTVDEIEDSEVVLKRRHARCTVQVGDHYVVKFGSQVDPLEGETMNLVRQNSAVPVPQVFAIYQHDATPHTTITYIIMEHVAGRSLDALWITLNRTEKKRLALQLHNTFNSLRRIPHLGYFGSIDMTKPRDDVFWTDRPIRPDHGTFNSEEQFHVGVIAKYALHCGASEPQKTEYYRRALPKALEGTGDPVFTHNDLQRKNIIVRPGGGVVITGWASSGWYPSYWEYATAIHLCNWKDEWHEYVGKILEEFPRQEAWVSRLRKELWSHRLVR
ncbi:hypothetical protein ACHAPT_012794 [Fusarium lateritium]